MTGLMLSNKMGIQSGERIYVSFDVRLDESSFLILPVVCSKFDLVL